MAPVLLSLTSGERNSALGRRAGYAITTGSDNLLVSHEGGAADEANTVRIGTHPATLASPMAGEQSRAFLAGVHNQTIGGTNHPVCVDDASQLFERARAGSDRPVGSGPRGFVRRLVPMPAVDGLAWGAALDQLAVAHHWRSANQYILDSFGCLHRIAVGGSASHRSGIEDR